MWGEWGMSNRMIRVRFETPAATVFVWLRYLVGNQNQNFLAAVRFCLGACFSISSFCA